MLTIICINVNIIYLEGAGHWVVAHRTCMDDKMPELTKHAGSSTRTESEHPNRSTQKAARNTLDGKQLVRMTASR